MDPVLDKPFDDERLSEALDNYEAYQAMVADEDFGLDAQRGGIVHDPLAGKVVIKPNGSRRSPMY